MITSSIILINTDESDENWKWGNFAPTSIKNIPWDMCLRLELSDGKDDNFEELSIGKILQLVEKGMQLKDGDFRFSILKPRLLGLKTIAKGQFNNAAELLESYPEFLKFYNGDTYALLLNNKNDSALFTTSADSTIKNILVTKGLSNDLSRAQDLLNNLRSD